MPEGKPAMVRCIQLTDDLRCAIFGQPSRPLICQNFTPEQEICGNYPEEAKKIFEWLLV